MLFALLGAHCFFDYAGQGDFVARAKNVNTPVPGIPWWNVLTAHAVQHGAAVALITGIWWLGVAEVVAHWLTDNAKCRGRIGFNTDQAVHVGCKLAWFAVAVSS
jgi:hypothetical protein